MTAKRLCIDIDNVLAQTDVLMRKLIKEHTRTRVELRYEDIVTFDYRQCLLLLTIDNVRMQTELRLLTKSGQTFTIFFRRREYTKLEAIPRRSKLSTSANQ